jgi:osmoprotectant transport system substrate-binding protein
MQGGRAVSARRISVALGLLAVLCAGLIAGLGAGAPASAGVRTTSGEQARPGASTSHGARATTGPSTDTTSTLTQPTVTVVTTATTPAGALPGHGRPTIVVGDMNTPEQFVLGALYIVALSHAGYRVEPTRNIGPYYIAQQALKQGSLDLYPDYLDSNLLPSWDRTVAGIRRNFRNVRAAYAAGASYARRRGFMLVGPTPGGDTLGLAVTSQFAEENDVTSMAQLYREPLLTFGMPLGFGGLWRAEKAYRFRAAVVRFGATGDQYRELDAGSVQVTYADSTDPQLSEPRYVLLADPKHVYGFGNIVAVTTPRVVRAEGPAFLRIIRRVNSLLTTRALRGLNAEVQLKGHSQNGVAEQFLQGNGVIPPDTYRLAPS